MVQIRKSNLLPTFYLSHGGGPCFFMDWSSIGPAHTWDKMADWLKSLAHTIQPIPRSILVISAHWEESQFTIMDQESPPLLYDYYGFPKHTYELTYPAPSSPQLAKKVKNLLSQVGFQTQFDSERGFDHGVFVPFKLIYPFANIPIVQLSLKKSLDPEEHIAVGKALTPLREEGVLIVGSGMSYHNLREFFGGRSVERVSADFDSWLTQVVTSKDPNYRNDQLIRWENAPLARLAHPREEHLIPLLVAAGAAGEDLGNRIFVDQIMGAVTSAYRFG